jgi:hypothetical protein
MSFGWTNRGKYLLMQLGFRNTGWPTNPYVALVAKKNEKSINNAAATNEGGGKVGIPVTSHGYPNGAAVFISGTVNYNGRFIVDASSTTNKVIIVATYQAETFTGAEKIHEAPGPITNLMSDLVEIVAGNGYTAGGISLTRNSTDFPGLTEDDANALGKIQVKDLVWTAAGGNLPGSGNGARYAVLTDDNGTVSSRQVIAYWDLGADRTVSDTQTLTVHAAELQGKES